ncbi:Uncharacterised protein [Mycobacteroides abscessus subsp. abscessus]|nr:Uncharacterised protein [Mycobacteroides abscessus subsp. abscessus]
MRNRIAGGAGSSSTKFPCGAARRTIVPGSRPLTRWVDRNPSGIALTVMVMVRAEPPACRARRSSREPLIAGADVSE